MENINEKRLLLYAIGLGICSIIERVITIGYIETDFIKNILNMDPKAGSGFWIYHGISIVILLLLFLTATMFLRKFIHSKLANKFFTGKFYVEGRWLEKNCKQGTTNVDSYCCLDISYEEDGIHLTGTNFKFVPNDNGVDGKCEFNYAFVSNSASMDRNSLIYTWHINGGFWTDWGILNFLPNFKLLPNRYTGSFHRKYPQTEGDVKKGTQPQATDEKDTQYNVTAVLVTDKEDIRSLDENLKENIKRVFAKYDDKGKNVPRSGLSKLISMVWYYFIIQLVVDLVEMALPRFLFEYKIVINTILLGICLVKIIFEFSEMKTQKISGSIQGGFDMKITKNKGVFLATVLIIFAVYSVVALVIPFEKGNGFLISCGFSVLALLLTIGICLYAFKYKKSNG